MSPTYVLGLAFAGIILVTVFTKMRNFGSEGKPRNCGGSRSRRSCPCSANPEVDGVPPASFR